MELLEQILSNQNMNQAYKRVYRNKGASGVMNGGKYEETLIGTSQDENLSPLLSNIMLNARGLRFARYADDSLKASFKTAGNCLETVGK